MTFQELFTESKGKSIIYKGREIVMVDRIELTDDTTKINIKFLHTDSIWKQGIILQNKGHFEIGNKKASNKIILWENTAPKEVELIIKSNDKMLIIYNAWKTEDGTLHYWHNGGAMFIEKQSNTKIYHCNDGYPDEDFNDLIFELNIG